MKRERRRLENEAAQNSAAPFVCSPPNWQLLPRCRAQSPHEERGGQLETTIERMQLQAGGRLKGANAGASAHAAN